MFSDHNREEDEKDGIGVGIEVGARTGGGWVGWSGVGESVEDDEDKRFEDGIRAQIFFNLIILIVNILKYINLLF